MIIKPFFSIFLSSPGTLDKTLCKPETAHVKIFLAAGLVFLLSGCNRAIEEDAYSYLPSTEAPDFEAMEILSAHNRIRSQHGLPALSWSRKLAGYSRQWANKLKNRYACRMRHRPTSPNDANPLGENLYWASAVAWSDGNLTLQEISSNDVVHDWARERKYYNHQSNRCAAGQQCGHYTQIVWKSTKAVGCAVSVCNDKSQVWVCTYDPAGNWVGERPF